MPKPHRSLPHALAALAYLTVAAVTPAPAAEGPTKLLRFPDVHGDKVVFTYAGDLWTAPSAGGTATRLTAHPGLELFAKFSPDGQWIAFTGQYDGDEQVYVVAATGGIPRQLTWYPAQGPLPPRWGYDNQVYGWTPDGQAVIFRSLMDGWDLTDSRLYTVPLSGALPTPLAMPISGAGELSPDGRRAVYSPLVRDFRTWKRYEGGWAQDLWIMDLASQEAVNVTNHVRTDRDPMWIGDSIYFVSDRDDTLNLYALDPTTKAVRQLTRHRQWDVRWASGAADGQIVYELGGELRLWDTRVGAERALAITVPDDGLAMRPARVSAANNIEFFDLSPKGERALVVARGDVFTVPIEKGNVRNLTRTSRWHDKGARWSPDGRQIAFLSDRSGEEELWLVDQGGAGEPVQLTSGGSAFRYAPEWSDDGKRLAFGDKDGRVWVVEVATKKLLEIANDRRARSLDYAWAPGGQHLAYSLANENGTRSLWIWSVGDGTARQITSDWFAAYSPAWDPKGNYLYYLADREWTAQISSVEWNFATARETGIFALALRKDVAHPFPPQSDEVTVAKEGTGEGGEGAGKDGQTAGKKSEKNGKDGKDKGAQDAAAAEKPKLVRIDWEGLAERVTQVPVGNDNYTGLIATETHLVYSKHGGFFYGRDGWRPNSIHTFQLEGRKEQTLAERHSGWAVSLDGKKILVRSSGSLSLYDVAGGKESVKPVSTADLAVDRVPAEEWAEVFDEVWRRYRDFFYVANMHGYDWKAIGEQYRSLLPHVAHRSDLNYLLGEMIAELNVGHAYISGGDFALPERPRVALPGARFALDPGANRYRIASIYRGENDEDRYRAPLTEVGVDARVGDYVLAIDGVELAGSDNPYRMLRFKSDRAVELTLNDKPTGEGARKVVFRPLDSEDGLLYLAWVRRNRERVAELSGGRVGYLHIPDMGGDGLREFIKAYYPQLRKEALILDARSNGGGNVSPMIIERLRRELLSADTGRLNDWVDTYPGGVHVGPKVAMINETTASDGDIFAAMFRQARLGPIVGKRSWGGVVGISDHGPLIDGGSVSVPESGTISVDGKWIIEGYGVDPDVVVENDPRSLLAGGDPQLEKAVAMALEAAAATPGKLPAKPAEPIKTKRQ
jgi:tricorn protease